MDSIGCKGFAFSLKLAILGQLIYELKNNQTMVESDLHLI